MRTLTLFLLTTALALPSFAAHHVTVDQLQEFISAARSRLDAELALQLADLELTERLNPQRMESLKAAVPGDKSRQALAALGDASAFLDVPAMERPDKAAPSFAEQRALLARTVAYVAKAIPQLPNFFATQQTTRFEDTPQLQKNDFFIPSQPLHSVGATSATVLYRDGQEAIDTGNSKKPPPMAAGLTTKGVFGPILSTVLLDAAQSNLSWSHWESSQGQPEAVFSFLVPQEKSHYEVSYCCLATEAATLVANLHPFRRIVGYRGDITVDPATGTILRLRVQADLKPTDPVANAAILVEYGPVEIGGKTYICPLKSISSTLAQTVQVDPLYKFPIANQPQPLKKSLNHVEFKDYHVFRAEARLVANADPAKGGLNPSAPIPDSPAAEAATSPVQPTTPAPTLNPAPIFVPAPGGIASLPLTTLEAVVPEISVTDISNIPDTPLKPQATAQHPGFVLQTTARLVDVGVVAYDKKGHPVTDLKPGDFEIEDNGRKQEIRYFVQSSPTAVAPLDPSTAKPGQSPIFTNQGIEPPTSPAKKPVNESRATILMIDAANIAWGDLSHVRSELLRFLKTVPPGEPVALYILKSYGFQVLTEPTGDHAPVADKLARWMPSAQELTTAQEKEDRSRQHIDWVAHSTDLVFVNGNDGTDPEGGVSGKDRASLASHGVDPQLRSMGSSPQRDALNRLETIAHHLGLYPGHKSLVWLSTDSVLADWEGQAATREDQGSNPIDPIALRAREALNESHVSIYPVDVSQLEASVISADLQNRLVQVKIASLADPAPSPPNPTGRYAAEMHQDTHPIQGTFRDLAEATGGRALRRASDIATEINSIVEDGRAAYLLSFTPDQPADDKYHLLTLRVNGRKDLKLRYRTGYEYNKEPITLKDRFRQTVLAATDTRDIGLTAVPAIGAKGSLLKLNITATDLDLAQQGELWTGKLDVFLVEQDSEGLHSKVNGQTLGLRLKSATYQRLLAEGVPFEVMVRPVPDLSSVRLVVVDENSGRMGSVTIPAANLAATP